MKKQFILCVDDERFVLNSLKDQLKSKVGDHFNIEVAENGEEALSILNELLDEGSEVPLIISDYIMPGMKGDELLKKIHELHPSAIKILLTGQATLDGIKNIINQANLYRYISKPWEREDLVLAVNEAVKSYEKDKKIEEQNQTLITKNQELQMWTEAFVEAMGTALDTRDVTTAGHSKRMAEYSVKTAEAINKANYGKFKNFFFSEEEIKELYYAALLHDIGKIGIREQILLKPSKISMDRQYAIVYKCHWYNAMLEMKKRTEGLEDEEIAHLKALPFYIKTITDMNGSESITEGEIAVLNEIAQISFYDFDGKKKNLIDDFEQKNLSVKFGTLTDEEREIINHHVEYTYEILKGIPWPKNLSRVPEIAASHHEKLNGKGYHKGLFDEQISIQARILAIIDIFEALTSPDRPYRKKKSAEEALDIIKSEVEGGYLDKDIFDILVKESVCLQ